MARHYLPTVFAVILFAFAASCSKDSLEAEKPVYLSIENVFVETDVDEEGTSHSKISTIWLFANDEAVGTFELPCTVPVLLDEGENEITIYPGVSINGISASRAIYEAYEDLDFIIDYQASGSANADTIKVPREKLTTSYVPSYTIDVFEDFDGVGSEMEPTRLSDTGIVKVTNAADVFVNPHAPNEPNGSAGAVYTTPTNNYAEVATVNAFGLPTNGTNVYLEINYKCNMPFEVGLIGVGPVSEVQRTVLTITPKEEWNKIYVNPGTELGALADAQNFKIFFRAAHPDGEDVGKLFLDNLKIVYRRL